MISHLNNINWNREIDLLSILPKEKLFQSFLSFRNSASENYKNIDYVLWGEALLEEISFRKYSREFEEALGETSHNIINITY